MASAVALGAMADRSQGSAKMPRPDLFESGPRGALLIILMVAVQLSCQQAMAACATVKIEISQEVTLERQAFDAHMRIKNDLEGLSLGNVNVDVVFTDGDGNTVTATSDANNTNALFFIKVDSMSGITDVSSSGVISPSSDLFADDHGNYPGSFRPGAWFGVFVVV